MAAITLVLHRVSLPTPVNVLWIMRPWGERGLTGAPKHRIFNQLTSSRPGSRFFPAFRAGLWRYRYEQENFPAEQPSSREGARIPSAHAHPRRPRHPRCTSPQGSHRTLRVVERVSVRPVLAQANRVVSGDDYRATVRGGYRIAAAHTVTFVRASATERPTRFGFIVSKAVGNAVIRNRVRRRLKAACFEVLPQHPSGKDIVIRALPASADAPWVTLQKEVHDAMNRGVRA